jgi:integrase
MNLQDAMDIYLKRRGICDTTRDDNARMLRYFLEEDVVAHGIMIEPSMPLKQITAEHLDAYEYSLCHRERRLRPNTVFKYMIGVWNFFNFLEKRGFLMPDVNPARDIVCVRPPRNADSKAIPKDILKEIVLEIRQKPFKYAIRDESIVRCLAAGLREREARLLRVEDVNLEQRFALVNAKGGQRQRRRLGPVTGDTLTAWLALRPKRSSDYVFVSLKSDSDKPLAEGVVSQMVRRVAHKVVNRPYGSHSLRHWLGQFMADNGVAPTVVAQTLGITVEVTLFHYYNQDDARVIQAADQYELGDF